MSPSSVTDTLARWHLLGDQYTDEVVASYPSMGTSDGKFYLADRMMTVVGHADGNGVASVYGADAFGDRIGRVRHDADGDVDIDLVDLCSLLELYDASPLKFARFAAS